jgi:hypothetical protein
MDLPEVSASLIVLSLEPSAIPGPTRASHYLLLRFVRRASRTGDKLVTKVSEERDRHGQGFSVAKLPWAGGPYLPVTPYCPRLHGIDAIAAAARRARRVRRRSWPQSSGTSARGVRRLARIGATLQCSRGLVSWCAVLSWG